MLIDPISCCKHLGEGPDDTRRDTNTPPIPRLSTLTCSMPPTTCTAAWWKTRYGLVSTILISLTFLRPILTPVRRPLGQRIQNSSAAAGLVPPQPERVLSQLNICLKTPTPLPSRSTISAPKTPYNLKQLDKKASTIKQLLRYRTQSPPSPIKTALNQLANGLEKALNGAAILAKENQDLHAVNEKKLQKRKRSTA